MAASPFTHVSPFLSECQSPLLPFRICPSDPRPCVLCCVQRWALYKVPPLCRRPCIRSAEPRAKVAYHVQSFPPSKPSAPPTYADTGCPWHFAKSRVSNVGVNDNINVNNNIAVNINVNTPFKPSQLPNQRRRWSSVAFCQNKNTKL